MKPKFALSLSFEGVRLLHHAAGGWQALGDVAFDNPNLDAAMIALLQRARALEPAEIRCKIIVPNEQVKYLKVNGTPDDVLDAARTALVGATPYPVQDLVIDTVQSQDGLYVAAITQETINEIVKFADQHGFIASSFAALAQNGEYPGEAHFDAPPAPAAAPVFATMRGADIDASPMPAAPVPTPPVPTSKAGPPVETPVPAHIADAAVRIDRKSRRILAAFTILFAVILFGAAGWASRNLDGGITGLFLPAPKEALAPQAIRPPDWSIAPKAPSAPRILDLGDLYITSIDPMSIQLDAIALPDLAARDHAPDQIAPPPPAATVYSFDENGLVIPSPDGAPSPDGFTVYAGRPAITPPKTPVRFETNPDDDLFRERLAKLRPKLRPGTLAETHQRANLGGNTLNELALQRPKLRPQSAQERAMTASLGSTFAPHDPEAGLAISPRPRLRPTQLATLSAPQKSPTTPAVKPALAPAIPTSASIAKAATDENVMSLRQVNLIGVYGKPAARRALVRLANGRYLKVEVGDKLDGGKISAIGEGELRYQKSGRNLVIKMPKS